MSWQEFLIRNQIGTKFHRASFQNDKVMSRLIFSLGLKWIANPTKSLILFGDTGRGKTYFMLALIFELFKKFPLSYIRFFKNKRLDDRICEEFRNFGGSSNFINSIIDVPVVFIDDFGVERPTERAARDMYEIIDGRGEWERATVISTNLNDSDIEDVYGNRILSRLKEYAWISFSGHDLRGKL